MHRVWKHLCLARRRDAWYALGRQRDSSPAGADVLAPTCVGAFFMAGYTGHKKDPISFEAGLAPSSSPAALYPLPCRIILAAETKQFCPVAPVIKRHISFEAGLAPSSSPAALYPLPCRIFSMGETKQFCPVVSAIKRPDLIRSGPRPLELPRGAISSFLPSQPSHRQQKEHSAEAECSSFGLFCFGWLVPNQAAFFALACAASALLPSTTRSMARMTSRMARIARM